MRRIIIALAVISLTGSAAFAQKVRSDNQDIRFTAGVRIPFESSRANNGEVMSLTYGRYNDKGFGLRGGVQWMFENMDIDDYLGIPLSVCWSSGRRTFKESLENGVYNAAWGAFHDKYYYGTDPDAGSVLGDFFMGLFNRIEFFAGVTPGYIFGHSNSGYNMSSSGSTEYVNHTYIKHRLSLSADAGLSLSIPIWRFQLSVTPSFHYFITDNYREIGVNRVTHDGGTDEYTSDKSRSWQVAIQGGLSFSF